MVLEDSDGVLGWLAPADAGGWDWQTDLKGLRMAQQLQGSSPTLEAAQDAFKAAYERWRSKVSDEQFDAIYRRSGPL